ncbi:hypothetical protein E0765_07195 [Sulfuricurvum sp. IAE1]|uniref:DNA cytosine methyltransferase n=1 Tax=Sulfuricurvum sp. IAE1 TaxID=2546102 RepID=UPI0010490EB1|nr:DNA cytosine methyltransferase [Sulfuricurvum sp. IAE1]TDA63613.1 hypothetical protein E0765_07195 [Sulfuricurvum sp. IAE1]
MKEEIVLKVGANKARPNTRRIWCQSQILSKYGFEKATAYMITYDMENAQIIIESSVIGERTVSGTEKRPIIDIENVKIKEMFEGVGHVHIEVSQDCIVVSASDRAKMLKNARRKAKENDSTFVELYCGGGTLSSAMMDAGFTPICAVDMDVEQNSINKTKEEEGIYHSINVLETYRANFPDCKVIQAPVNQIDMRKRLPQAGVLVAGIPCQSASKQGVTKRKQTGAAIRDEALPQLVFPVIEAVLAVEPHTVLIEEVEGFANSYSADFLKAVLEDFGYTIHENFVDGKELNAMSKRRRYCMVATVVEKFKFIFKPLEPKTIGSIIEGNVEDHEWKAFENYKAREEKNLAEGRNFTMNVIRYDDTITGTFGAGYAKCRVSEPLLAHPDPDTELFRLFTAREIARIHGLSEDYILPDSFTAACHVLGNGVLASGWRQVAHSIKAALAA